MNSNAQKLVFLESSDIGVRYSAEAARSMGYEPVFLCDLRGFQADPLVQLAGYEHYDCDTSTAESVLRFIREKDIQDIAAVTTFADARLLVACQVARELKVAGLDPAVPLLKDKGTVASMTPEYSPPSPVIDKHNTRSDELLALLRKHDTLLVKPADGQGGAGIFHLTNADDIAALPTRFAQASPRDTWVVQPLIEGQLVSAEGHVREGRVRVLGFSGRRRIRSTETGAQFPIDESIPAEIRSRAVDAIHTLVARSGFRNGYFHIEFLCNYETCYLIDANMGRIGGGPIAELIALAFDLKPEQIFQHVLELSLFGMHETRLYAPFLPGRSAYAVLYGLEKGGTVEEVILPSSMACFHTQIIANGASVRPIGEDDWCWVGILTGLTDDTLETIERVRIRSSGEELKPHY